MFICTRFQNFEISSFSKNSKNSSTNKKKHAIVCLVLVKHIKTRTKSKLPSMKTVSQLQISKLNLYDMIHLLKFKLDQLDNFFFLCLYVQDFKISRFQAFQKIQKILQPIRKNTPSYAQFWLNTSKPGRNQSYPR